MSDRYINEYNRLPVVVNTFAVGGTLEYNREMFHSIGIDKDRIDTIEMTDSGIRWIRDNGDYMYSNYGDRIINSGFSEPYSCERVIFYKTYDAVTEYKWKKKPRTNMIGRIERSDECLMEFTRIILKYNIDWGTNFAYSNKITNDKVILPTLEGDLTIEWDSLIAFGIDGEPYPITQETFNTVYGGIEK